LVLLIYFDMKAFYFKHILNFKIPAGTSRGFLKKKTSWYIIITNGDNYGIGECSLIYGLSPDPILSFEHKLKEVCRNINKGFDKISKTLKDYPSILFGLETAYISYESTNPFILFKSDFTSGKKFIPVNGLVWMGEKSYMINQIKEKIEHGFNCIKIKVGAIDFSLELELLKSIRSEYSDKDIEIRLDANGAFDYKIALDKLNKLSKFKIHSIEQPIGIKQWKNMSVLCEKSPIDIVLDEDLIGINDIEVKRKLLSEIKPSYIVLKPSLIGGLKNSEIWIQIANSLGVKWWSTSALESNIGLNVISQWVFKRSSLNQGLGTGMLYSNNIDSPTYIENGFFKNNPKGKWNTILFDKYIK
tara:strand:+ start:31377 stop:32450 length:1074 start_codon:yes stop_codon:yes gene_type:complete